jgi:bifunctional non-homologous end joining protein LigD
MPADSLRDYHRKRDFTRTSEPKGATGKGAGKRKSANKPGKLRYLIQKHDATRLHYDFRLEWNGTLMSWAVPKGPSENPDDKRLAVHVEDHPLEYGNFEGTIPKGEYGGGTVMLWDTGTWEPHEEDVDAALEKGKLAFTLNGKRLHGNWALVRLRKRSPKDKDNWLLIKERDEFERKSGKLATERETSSVKSGRSMDQIAGGRAVWHSDKSKAKAAAESAVKVPAKAALKKAAPKRKIAAAGSKKKPRKRK